MSPRPFGAQLFAAECFAEEVRRELAQMFGKDTLGKGGLSVRTTLDPKLQIYARQALARGLIAFDRKRGYRGPIKKIEIQGDWGLLLEKPRAPADVAPWRMAVVLEVNDEQAVVGLQPKLMADGKLEDARETGTVPVTLMGWARSYVDGTQLGPKITKATDVLARGDVVYVAPAASRASGTSCKCPMWKVPSLPWTPTRGACFHWLAGFPTATASSTAQSRPCASRALRSSRLSMPQPWTTAIRLHQWCSMRRSNIKLPNGDVWKPKNYQNKFFGPSTLRRGIEQSRNVMTVRLADDLGMTKIVDLAQRLGLYDKMPLQLSMALGAGETTLMKMTTAYSIFANGGKKIQATLIDRIQDRYGRTIFRYDKRDCSFCKQETYAAAAPNLNSLMCANRS